MTDIGNILLVEDEEIQADLIKNHLLNHDYQVAVVQHAEAALSILEGQPDFDVIVLDRGLPGMDGLTMLRRIKARPNLSHIPVVMETSFDDVERIREGLSAGAYYYLTKPVQPTLLMAVVQAALEQYREYQKILSSLHQIEFTLMFLTSGTFQFKDLAGARNLAIGIARLCPDPERVLLGLQELLINAVEHGNLGISYAEKTQLVLDGLWVNEVERRLAHPELGKRHVSVTTDREPNQLTITIKDEGSGFDWESYLDFSPERAFDPHGRGIAMAKTMSFDTITYLDGGSRVVVTVNMPE